MPETPRSLIHRRTRCHYLLTLAAAALLVGCERREPAPPPSGRVPVELRREAHAQKGLPADTAFGREVREAFLHAWSAYEAYAWGHDALRPLSHGWRDWRDTTLVTTPLDAFDTMLLMGLDAAAAQAKELILERLSFDHYMTVQVFEVNISLLGGLLSACQMDGDPRWRETGKDMFYRVVAPTRVDAGFAHLKDVRTGEKNDAIESFFLAATLKYAWLLAEPSAVDFDAVVFNTKGHPLRPVTSPQRGPRRPGSVRMSLLPRARRRSR